MSLLPLKDEYSTYLDDAAHYLRRMYPKCVDDKELVDILLKYTQCIFVKLFGRQFFTEYTSSNISRLGSSFLDAIYHVSEEVFHPNFNGNDISKDSSSICSTFPSTPNEIKLFEFMTRMNFESAYSDDDE